MSARRVLVTLFSLVAAVTAIAENPIDACNVRAFALLHPQTLSSRKLKS